MNFLAIIRSRPLSGLLCLIFSIASFISLQLNEINDYALNPFIVIILAIVSLLFFIIRQQGLVLLSICFVALFSGAWSVLNLIHSFDKGVVMGLDAWLLVSALWFLTWNNLVQLSALKTKNKLIELSLNYSHSSFIWCVDIFSMGGYYHRYVRSSGIVTCTKSYLASI